MPSASSANSLDPAVIDKLSGLDFVATRVVEGFLAGQHRSPYHGSSVEFAQHREYVPGDDLRHVDWKIYARSERLVVKEYVAETNLSCHLLVDASESMSFGSLNWSKFDYARWCAAALAHLVLSQRDSAGLVLFDESARHKVPPGSGAHQKAGIIHTLEEATTSGTTQVGEVLNWIAGRLRNRGIVAVFSDLFDDVAAVIEGVRRLVHEGHEPILFQILDPREIDFEYSGFLRLDGLENSGRMVVDPKTLRAAYRQEFEAHQSELAKMARALGVDFVPISTETGLEVALSTYLARRAARARGMRA